MFYSKIVPLVLRIALRARFSASQSIRLVETVEVRETGIDMELKTSGMTTLVKELAGLSCEVNELRENQ